MGGFICCKKNKKFEQYRFKFTKFQSKPEATFKSKAIFSNQFLKALEQRYYALKPNAGLNLEQLQVLLPNIQPKLLYRLLMYFKLENEDQIDLQGICFIISKFLNQGKLDQIELLFNLYDLDQNKKLDQNEFKLFVEENQNLLNCNINRFQKFDKIIQFTTWGDQNLNLSQTFFFKIFQRPYEEKRIIEEQKDQIVFDKIYIISSKWWDQWKQYVNRTIANPEQPNDQNIYELSQEFIEISPQQWLERPGPIDNRDIDGEYEGELKVQLIKGRDYETVGQEAWNNLMRWYGIIDKRLEFKRKCETINDKLTIELYPTIIQGFETDENGKVQYKNCFRFKMYEYSTMHDVRKKLFKKFQISTNKYQEYLLYMMKINEDWQCILDLDSDIISLNITSGTFFTMTKLKKKPVSQVSYWKLGQKILITDPSTNIEKMCLVQRFSESLNFVILHIEGQSSLDDFQIEIKQSPMGLQSTINQAISKQIKYPGLQNLGNTCYMNAALQCLITTQYFSNFLINERYKRFITANNSLTKELSSLTQELTRTNETSISPQNFQNVLIKILPKFRKYQAQDADEFLDDLLTVISKELNEHENNQNSVIEKLFQGQYLTEKSCQQCPNIKSEIELKKILHLTVQEQSGVFKLRIYFFLNLFRYDGQQQTNNIIEKDLVKKTILITNNTINTPTFRDLYNKIDACIGLSKEKYQLAIIYKKDIQRIIYSNNENQALTDLGINPNMTIFLYQLGDLQDAQNQFDNVRRMFSYKSRDFQKNDLVDFQETGQNWKQGKIDEIKPNQFKILHLKDNNLGYVFIQENKIVQFRQNTSNQQLNFVQIPVLNYYFNSFQKQYLLGLKPIIVYLPIQQLSLIELKVYIYKQIQRFINFDHFTVQSPFQTNSVQQEQIINFFSHISFPYKIRVLDQDRKCLYCQKIRPEKNISYYHCQGCEVDPILLIFQQTTKPRIILEWNDIKFTKILEKKKDESEERLIQNLDLKDCFQKYTEESELRLECKLCGQNNYFKQQSYLNKPPIILILNLQKYKSNGEFIERYVDFPLNSLNINECLKSKENVLYDLYAVINSKRKRNDTHYTAYLKKQDQWYEFDDSNVSKIEKVQSTNAYMLFYTCKNIPDDCNINMSDFI
ncbi:unnamed protein product [Paramecium pentaurelia]|uniref:Ubiquitinyl hydrolase 1 n=1 Tax=Paramecium pentaurelia TaxID=43138 RepID=A0A8S1ULS6_9CILI|nr:unnamed protein product [Paramecium pentaurelia]